MYKPCPEESSRGAVRVVFWSEDGRDLARHGQTHGRVFARVFQLRVISTHGRGICPCLESPARVLLNYVRVLPLTGSNTCIRVLGDLFGLGFHCIL